MLTLAPDPTIPQPVRALGIANTRRSAAAVLTTRLRRREITLDEILANPPAELERQMTWEVLLWTPGIGRTRLRDGGVGSEGEHRVFPSSVGWFK